MFMNLSNQRRVVYFFMNCRTVFFYYFYIAFPAIMLFGSGRLGESSREGESGSGGEDGHSIA